MQAKTGSRYIEKFVQNKQVPTDAQFALTQPNGEVVTIDLHTTVLRIYENGQGNDVKRVLKKGRFRNATIEQCLKLFEGAAQRFLLDDMDSEQSKLVQDVLEKTHRRKDTVFIEFKENTQMQTVEIIFKDDDNVEQPYLMKYVESKEIVSVFSKREFIEHLLQQYEVIKQVI